MSFLRRATLGLAAATLALGLALPTAVLADPPNADKTPQAGHQQSHTDMLRQLGESLTLPPQAEWKVGQAATHKLTVDSATDGTLTADVRFAITGQEEGAYWLEWNITNLGGTMGKDIATMVGGLHIRLLTHPITETELKSAITTATGANPASTLDNLVKKLQFQLAGGTLYEVDLSELKSMLPMVLPPSTTPAPESTTGTPAPAGPEPEFKSGRENVTVPAGTFNNSLFWQVDYAEAQAAGNLHVDLHENVPLLPFVKVVLNASGKDVGGTMQVKLELLSSAQSGAATMTKGPVVQKTLDTIISELFSTVMGGGTLSSTGTSGTGSTSGHQ